MNHSKSFFVLLVAFLTGCSATPATSESFRVTSVPPGAEVLVLGESLGQTPLHVPLARVFPVTYPPDKQDLYGRIVLRHAGCQDYAVPVSTTIATAGLKASLVCETQAPAAVAAPTASVADRLRLLDQLRRDELVTEDEYQRQRQRILDSL